MPMKLDSRQTRQRSKLDQLSTTTDLRLDAIMNLINDELTMPLRMRANLGAGTDGTPNQNLYIDSINVKTYDTGVADSGHERSRTIPPVGSSMPSYTGGGYITFPTTSGGSITGTGLTLDKSYTLTLTSGQYVKIMVWINGSSQFGMEIGTPAASEALALLPAPPTDAYVLGYIVMNNTGGTISKALNENIYQFVGGGGAGGGSGASREITQSNSFSVGDVVYFDGTNYVKAQANAASTAEAIGVVSKASATKFTLTELGYVTGLSGLTAGEVYYLSAATAGALTSTEPSTIGHVSKPMLIADSTTSGYVLNYRGSVVGGTNARTEISLSNNASTNTQLVTAYDAGEMTGWVVITGTTSYRFYVAIQFSKNAAGSDYNVSYQTSGETLPAGFSIQYSANYITVTLPSIAGFSSAKLNYALNAPAVGATFPLAVDASVITAGTVAAARLPVVVPGTSAGVVAAAGLPGNTTGNAIVAGYVGELISGTVGSVVTSITATGQYADGSISLGVGLYLVPFSVFQVTGSGDTTVETVFNLKAFSGTATVTAMTKAAGLIRAADGSANGIVMTSTGICHVRVTASAVLKAECTVLAGGALYNAQIDAIQAIRIA